MASSGPDTACMLAATKGALSSTRGFSPLRKRDNGVRSETFDDFLAKDGLLAETEEDALRADPGSS